MISTNLQQQINSFDEIVANKDDDFKKTGLKTTSLIRLGRLAVVDDNILIGATGKINSNRLLRLKKKFAGWLIDNKAENF